MSSILIGFAMTLLLAIGPILGAVWCAEAATRPETGVDRWSALLMGIFLALVSGCVVFLGVSLSLA